MALKDWKDSFPECSKSLSVFWNKRLMVIVYSLTEGHVGPPIPCNIVKLVDVEEMEYFAKNNQGEVR